MCTAQSIPLQQKLVICTLILLLKKGQARKEVFLGKLHEAYVKLCQQKQLKFENQTEFVALCDMLTARGIIDLKKNKEPRHTKVSICVLLLQESLFHFFHIFLTMTGDPETGRRCNWTFTWGPHPVISAKVSNHLYVPMVMPFYDNSDSPVRPVDLCKQDALYWTTLGSCFMQACNS